MKITKFIWRYAAVGLWTALASSAALAQSKTDDLAGVAPIVQVAPEPFEMVSEPVVPAASANLEQARSASPPVRFQPENSPFRLQPLKPIFEAVPIVPIAHVDTSGVGSANQPIASWIPDESLPPIIQRAPKSLPPIVQGSGNRSMGEESGFVTLPNSAPTENQPIGSSINSAGTMLQPRQTISHPAQAVPGMAAGVNPDHSEPMPLLSTADSSPSLATTVEKNDGRNVLPAQALADNKSTDSIHLLGWEIPPQDGAESPAHTLPSQDQAIVQENIPPPPPVVQSSSIPFKDRGLGASGEILSDYDQWGRCRHCSGKGCDHCSLPPIITGWSGVHSFGTQPAEMQGVGLLANSGAYDCCGFMTACSTLYGQVDYLYYERKSAVVFGGNFSGYDEYGWSHGARGVVGRRLDCANGWEFAATGFDPWISITTETSAAGLLQGNLIVADGFPAASLSAFADATFLEQMQQTKMFGGEINRTFWGWDVVKHYIGVRFLYLADEFRLSSANVLGEQGYYFLDLENLMVGPQIGTELFYDIGYRWSCSLVTRLGAYVNSLEGQTTIWNDGDLELNAADRDSDFAASAEVGIHGRYQILPRVRARYGYDLMGIWNVGTGRDNFSGVVTPTTGQSYRHTDDVFLHGGFLGVEFYR